LEGKENQLENKKEVKLTFIPKEQIDIAIGELIEQLQRIPTLEEIAIKLIMDPK